MNLFRKRAVLAIGQLLGRLLTIRSERCNLQVSVYTTCIVVINLYPSVPIGRALETIEDFATNHCVEIDDFGISVNDFMRMLKFVSYNYKIQFGSKTFLQIRG